MVRKKKVATSTIVKTPIIAEPEPEPTPEPEKLEAPEAPLPFPYNPTTKFIEEEFRPVYTEFYRQYQVFLTKLREKGLV